MDGRNFLLFFLLGFVMRVSYAHKVHVVGGGFGWKIPPNASFYQEWASTKTFVVGDKLLFMYRTSVENVLEVSGEDYKTCGNSDIKDIYYEGPTFVQLSTPGPHFFYCGIGLHCEDNQKLAVNVGITAPSPPFVADDSLYAIGDLEVYAAPAPSPLNLTGIATSAVTRRYVLTAVYFTLLGGFLYALGM